MNVKVGCLIWVVICVAATGCSSPGPPSQGNVSPSQLSRAEWKPKQPITHPKMSDTEALRLRAEHLTRLAKIQEVTNPPKVDLVRWTTMEDVGPTMAACLRDDGFNAVAVGGTGVEYPDGITEAQMSAFSRANYVCASRYSIHPRFMQTFTVEQWGLFYDYMVEFLVPCLEGTGQHVSRPPNRETFVARAVQGERDWDPYAEVAEKTGTLEGRIHLAVTCPKDPPVEYMWGNG